LTDRPWIFDEDLEIRNNQYDCEDHPEYGKYTDEIFPGSNVPHELVTFLYATFS